MSDRERALMLLRRIERESSYASLLLRNESGFVRTLVFAVLRWRSRLDFVIDTLAKRAVEPEIRHVLRLGAAQLLFLKVAPHAAVGETVQLAPLRARGFVNALLRKMSRGEMAQPPDVATRTAHPPWLIERWSAHYGADRAARIAEADQELSFPDAMTDAPPPDAKPSSLVPGMWKLSGSSAEVEGYALDEGSAVIADLAAAAGDGVLDLCAAPGGKTLVLRTRGRAVISNDISISRLRPLLRGPEAAGALVVSDGRRAPFRRRFPVVLLDAPCSATGTIRKNPELKWRLREDDLPMFAALQRELLASALDLAADTVLYSTCSLEPEENDDVVAEALAANAAFEVGNVEDLANAEVSRWVDRGVLRLTPDAGTDGFTAHVLRRRH